MSRGDEMARRSFASLARLGTVAHACTLPTRLPPSPPAPESAGRVWRTGVDRLSVLMGGHTDEYTGSTDGQTAGEGVWWTDEPAGYRRAGARRVPRDGGEQGRCDGAAWRTASVVARKQPGCAAPRRTV